jgi:hypothetical protein
MDKRKITIAIMVTIGTIAAFVQIYRDFEIQLDIAPFLDIVLD